MHFLHGDLADVYSLLLAASHDFNLTGDGSLILRPKLGLGWTSTSFDDYNESAALGDNLTNHAVAGTLRWDF